MGNPTPSDVHVDALLTSYSLAYLMNPENFIATRVFPRIPVAKQSDKYPIWDKNDFMRDEMQVRPPGTESAGSGFRLSTTTYYADVLALHKDIDNQTRANADSVINLERATSRWLTQQGLLKMEKQFTADYLTTGVWATDKVGTTDFVKWSDRANSDPQADIETGKLTMLTSTGYEPNTLVLGYQSFQTLKQHPAIKDQIKYTSANTITADMLAAIFEIDRIFVAKASQATNLEGETASYGLVTSDSALLAYVDPNPGLEVASAGYTFMWNGLNGSNGEVATISQFYMDEIKSDRYEIEMAWDNKVVAADLGYFFSDVA